MDEMIAFLDRVASIDDDDHFVHEYRGERRSLGVSLVSSKADVSAPDLEPTYFFLTPCNE